MTKTRVISASVDSTHYTADACIVWCFDDRFTEVLNELTNKLQLVRYDLVRVAGGAKDLVSGANGARDYILDQIKTSLKLHHATQILLMVHAGCGAYNRKFSGADEEYEFYASELRKAAVILRDHIPGEYPIGLYYADFGGVWLVS